MLDPQQELLSPADALNRFQPPEGYAQGAREGDELPAAHQFERLRYGFRAGGVGLLIDPDTASEVIEPLPLSALPNTPAWLAGLINLRGNLIPVFDLVTMLGLSQSPDAGARHMLILGEGELAAAVLIDELPQVPELDRKLAGLPPLPALLVEHVTDAYVSKEFVWLEFHHHSFFSSVAPLINA